MYDPLCLHPRYCLGIPLHSKGHHSLILILLRHLQRQIQNHHHHLQEALHKYHRRLVLQLGRQCKSFFLSWAFWQ